MYPIFMGIPTTGMGGIMDLRCPINCEIFDLLDSRDFDVAKPIWEGDLATGIFRYFFHAWGWGR